MLACIAYSHPSSLFCNPNSSIRQQIPLKRRLHVVALESKPAAEGASAEHTPWLIAGLGNPGNKYHGTRHNVGFEMVDCIARAESIRMNTIQSKALLGIGSYGTVPVLLVKPQTYMNYIGESIRSLAAYYQVPRRHILLIFDEMSLPNSVLMLTPKGSHRRHNGVINVIDHLNGYRAFPRLSIGVGNPPGTMDTKAFLLQKFSSEERLQMNAAFEEALQPVRTVVLKGFDDTITRFNLSQKYKFHKVADADFN